MVYRQGMADDETVSTTGSAVRKNPVERAFALLQAVVAADEPVGIRELERRTGIPRSTVSRSVALLASLGMVERTSGGDVLPGAALATLQATESVSAGMRDQLRPLLVELVDRFGESAAITLDDGAAVQYVLQLASPQAVKAPSVENERHDFHVVAPGLIHMAWWPKSRLEPHLSGQLGAPTEHSVFQADAIATRLDEVRENGWAWTNQELDVGVNGLAVPVFNSEDTLIAAVSLFGPAYRFAESLLPRLAAEVAALVRLRSTTYL